MTLLLISSPVDLLITLIVAGICSLIYNKYFSPKARMKRKMKETEVHPISAVKSGDTVNIRGEVIKYGIQLKAPLSGRACCYYHVVIEEREPGRKNSSRIVLADEEKAGTVIIKQNDDYALIRAEDVKSFLTPDANYSSGFLKDATPELEKFLESHGLKSTGLFGFNKKLSYSEGILEEGEQLAVRGVGVWKNTKQLKLKLPVQQILVIGPDANERVYLTDDPEIVERDAQHD